MAILRRRVTGGRTNSRPFASTRIKMGKTGDVIGVVTQRDAAVADPDLDDLHRVGSFARVVDLVRLPSGDFRVALEATQRFELSRLAARAPYWRGEGAALEETIRTSVPKGTEELNLGAFSRGFTHGALLLEERGGRDPDGSSRSA